MRNLIVSNPAVVFVAAVGLLALSCSSIRQVQPLDVGQSAVHATLGGPIADVGRIYIPLPLLSLGYNYGLVKSVDVEAGVGITHALFGIMAIDLGANWRPIVSNGLIPGVIVSPQAHIMTDFKPSSLRVYPALNLTGWWNHRDWLYPYLGIENWVEYHTQRTDGNPQTHHWLIAPYLGVTLTHGAWEYQVEGLVYEPNLRNDNGAPARIGFGAYGSLGVFLGAGYEFGKKK